MCHRAIAVRRFFIDFWRKLCHSHFATGDQLGDLFFKKVTNLVPDYSPPAAKKYAAVAIVAKKALVFTSRKPRRGREM